MAGLKPVSAQVEQNPFWVLPNLSNTTMNFVKNLQTPNPVGTLPFTTPPNVPDPGYPQFGVRNTSANGIFDECGDVIFYVMNDNVFDENGISNVSRNLRLKDRWIKWNKGLPDDYATPDPGKTENFESPIFSIPGIPDTYYLLYSDCSLGGSDLRYATYNTVTKSLTQDMLRSNPPVFSAPGFQLRMAVSDLLPSGGRDIYLVDRTNQVARLSISSGGVFSPEVILKPSDAIPPLTVCPELELSPSGEFLAWASSGFEITIHIYNVSNGQYTTFNVAPGAIQRLTGLEFTRNDFLAISADWDPLYGSPPGTNANDGIMIIDPSFTSGTHISGTDFYIDAMIELAADNAGNYIYANNGSSMIAINVNTYTIDATYSIPSVGSNNLSTVFNFGPTFPGPTAGGALPDQNDGEFYVFPLNCSPGGSNGPPGGPPGGNRISAPQPPRIVPLEGIFIKTVH